MLIDDLYAGSESEQLQKRNKLSATKTCSIMFTNKRNGGCGGLSWLDRKQDYNQTTCPQQITMLLRNDRHKPAHQAQVSANQGNRAIHVLALISTFTVEDVCVTNRYAPHHDRRNPRHCNIWSLCRLSYHLLRHVTPKHYTPSNTFDGGDIVRAGSLVHEACQRTPNLRVHRAQLGRQLWYWFSIASTAS